MVSAFVPAAPPVSSLSATRATFLCGSRVSGPTPASLPARAFVVRAAMRESADDPVEIVLPTEPSADSLLGGATKVVEDVEGEDVWDENATPIELAPPQWKANEDAISDARTRFRLHETDTGSPEYQISGLTTRITYLTNHLKLHPKDFSSSKFSRSYVFRLLIARSGCECQAYLGLNSCFSKNFANENARRRDDARLRVSCNAAVHVRKCCKLT
jgi:Ribosomal protein S15